jgi:hypothetical protein
MYVSGGVKECQNKTNQAMVWFSLVVALLCWMTDGKLRG